MELQVRRDLVEIGGADDLLALERVGTQRRDGDRRVLQALFAAPRGYDDRFQDVCLQLPGLFGWRLGAGDAGQRQVSGHQ